jgi:iron complex outermembrane recepter protein
MPIPLSVRLRQARVPAGPAACTTCLLLPLASLAADAMPAELESIVVTAPRMSAPLLVATDPRQPRQPLPTNDGADYLRSIPGFASIRKGGTSGDPVFRGMAASRVSIVADGQHLLGGCGNRMDPPTAYLFPETYDRVIVVKGPQTVLKGPGVSAATVSFERDPERFDLPGIRGTGSALYGSAERTDLVADLRAGTPGFSGSLTGTVATAGDYSDGDGRRVHSAYDRWSASAAAAWHPVDRSRLELTGGLSDGEAAYADRSMDGVKFERESLNARFELNGLSPGVDALRLQAYHGYVDHVMDNFSLRSFVPTAAMPGRTVSNPDRLTQGARAEIDVLPGARVRGTVGVEVERNRHSVRSTMNETQRPYAALARVEDAEFGNGGVFGEFTWLGNAATKLIAGVRVDRWRAEDARATIAPGMAAAQPNPTAGEVRHETLGGGFARVERTGATVPLTLYAGVGHVERFPDYWELISKETADSLSAFGIEPERTTQLDAGLLYSRAGLQFSVSAFYSDVDDFILVQSRYPKGMRTATIARNVAATTWGGEADLAYSIAPSLQLSGSLAFTRGENLTDDVPLAQIAPLETRLALDYVRGHWTLGTLLRGVAEQDRFALNQGNVVGQDLGRTPGFAVLSLNGGWRSAGGLRLTAGIDNLFDRNYAEHLSRNGAAVSGYEQTTRVNEPGRVYWAKMNYRFD